MQPPLPIPSPARGGGSGGGSVFGGGEDSGSQIGRAGQGVKGEIAAGIGRHRAVEAAVDSPGNRNALLGNCCYRSAVLRTPACGRDLAGDGKVTTAGGGTQYSAPIATIAQQGVPIA